MEISPADSNKTDTAQRILAVAERLFGERGFNGVSTRDIAMAAGVSKANVFHHYSSKLVLYEAVLRSGSARFNELLLRLAGDTRELSELLDDFSQQHLQSMLEHQNAAALFVRHLLDVGGGAEHAMAENIVEQSHDLLMATFAALQREEKLAAQVDTRVLALTLIGGHLSFFLLRNVLARAGQPVPDAGAFSRTMVRQLIDGIARSPSSPDQKKLDQ